MRRGVDRQIYSIHAPGVAALVLPAFAAGRLSGRRRHGDRAWRPPARRRRGVAACWLTASVGAAWAAWLALVVAAPLVLHGYTIYPDPVGAAAAMAGVLGLVALDRRPGLVALTGRRGRRSAPRWRCCRGCTRASRCGRRCSAWRSSLRLRAAAGERGRARRVCRRPAAGGGGGLVRVLLAHLRHAESRRALRRPAGRRSGVHPGGRRRPARRSAVRSGGDRAGAAGRRGRPGAAGPPAAAPGGRAGGAGRAVPRAPSSTYPMWWGGYSAPGRFAVVGIAAARAAAWPRGGATGRSAAGSIGVLTALSAAITADPRRPRPRRLHLQRPRRPRAAARLAEPDGRPDARRAQRASRRRGGGGRRCRHLAAGGRRRGRRAGRCWRGAGPHGRWPRSPACWRRRWRRWRRCRWSGPAAIGRRSPRRPRRWRSSTAGSRRGGRWASELTPTRRARPDRRSSRRLSASAPACAATAPPGVAPLLQIPLVPAGELRRRSSRGAIAARRARPRCGSGATTCRWRRGRSTAGRPASPAWSLRLPAIAHSIAIDGDDAARASVRRLVAAAAGAARLRDRRSRTAVRAARFGARVALRARRQRLPRARARCGFAASARPALIVQPDDGAGGGDAAQGRAGGQHGDPGGGGLAHGGGSGARRDARRAAAGRRAGAGGAVGDQRDRLPSVGARPRQRATCAGSAST